MRTRMAMILVAVAALGLLGCDVNFNGYSQDHPKEDWELYDYVFSGPSPDPEGLDMLVKLNIDDDDLVTGEVMGVFYSKVEGSLTGATLAMEMTFVDNKCIDPGQAAFAGQIVGDKLLGHVTVWSCEWYEFDFEGTLVGGRILE